MKAQFHLALPCTDVNQTSDFYTDHLGAKLGRKSEKWVDVNLFGNQLTFTEAGNFSFDFKNYRLGDQVLPSFHFGVIVEVDLWGKLYAKLFQAELEVTTEAVFMQDKVGEHLSFFVKDPNGYMIEFKSFKDEAAVFKV
ncbi:VOC family protein [Sungkyunkwania multivorans]|uniref:VOC family protein n=1 Tax=Sungkyunkwania multivorans TaxID=1173618 RepID=A0ABW3CWB9_9FLAO